MDATSIGKVLVIFGVLIAGVGLMLWFNGGLGFLGKLPGDITVRRPNFVFHFPLATSILLSVVISLLLWLFKR